MKKLRSLICPVLAAGAGILSLGIAIMVCPLNCPDWFWAGPTALGSIVVIFAFGRSGAMAERCRTKQLRAQEE